MSIAVFSAFLVAFAVGHWRGGSDWHTVALPVAGLVVGGLPAAAFGGYLSKRAPTFDRRGGLLSAGNCRLSGVLWLVVQTGWEKPLALDPASRPA